MPDLLLIDDNADLRKVLREAVEINGFDVTMARSAEEALDLLNGGFQPAIIICDLALPRMNGLQFASAVRAHPQWASILFIAMSGNTTSRDAALEAGANHYLVKPFSFQELFDLLDQANLT
ncbi:MAG TPA: response regulator [Phototrophicaceae bacterium]|nr:response regulator [Phototrophicaceae bacterium]